MKIHLPSWTLYVFVLAVWAVYLVLSLNESNAETAQQLGVSWLVVSALRITVAVPYLATWMLAALGWANLRRYAGSLDNPAAAAGFNWIAKGLLVLLVGLMASALTGSVTDLMPASAWLGMTRLRRYLAVLFPFFGFLLIFIGAGWLLKADHAKKPSSYSLWYGILPPLLFGFFYMLLIFVHPAVPESASPGARPPFYLPASLIITTIVLPVVAGWALGLLAALRIERYTHYVAVKGQSAIVTLYSGLLAVLAGSIIGQALTSLGTGRLFGLGLALLLGLAYLYLAIMGLGYGLIAASSKRLLAQAKRSS